jgi:hypothetical protein
MKMPSKQEIEKELEIQTKLYDCYYFAISNATDENMRKRISELAVEHLSAKLQSLYYGVKIPVDKRMVELRRNIEGLGEK